MTAIEKGECGANAAPDALEKLAKLIATGRLRVPIAASFPVEQIRSAVELQADRHVKGKVVIDLQADEPLSPASFTPTPRAGSV